MRAKVPDCVAERWQNAKALYKLADLIRKKTSDHGGWYVATWPEEEPRVHGHRTVYNKFVDELYDLVTRLEEEAKKLEGCE